MKIAYCFCCHVRTWDVCIPTFKTNILSKVPGDIFVHTWNEQTSTNPSWWKQSGSKKEPFAKDHYLRAVQPKAYMIEESRSLVKIDSPSWLKQNAWSVKCAYESAIKSFELARSYGKYDIYFMLRSDIFWKSTVNLDELFNVRAIYSAKHKWFNDRGNYSDLFTHGNELFTKQRLDWFYRLDQDIFCNKDAHVSQEVEMSKYFSAIRLPVRISSLEYGVMRDTGQMQTHG